MFRDAKSLTIFIIFLIFLLSVTCCVRNNVAWHKMDQAEFIMNSNPDSALSILYSVPSESLKNTEDKARYALLMSMALDKNYVDTTNFDVLQPAIDYYLKNGTADNKLRTLYYQGRIYQNMGEEEKAMNVFIRGNDLTSQASDTLIIAHLLVAQAILYFKQYRISEYSNNNIKAAQLYEKIGNHMLEFKSYIHALDGFIMMSDKIKSDSVLNICYDLDRKLEIQEDYLSSSLLSYIIEFGTQNEIRNFLNNFDEVDLNSDDALNLAYGYSKIDDFQKATKILSNTVIKKSEIDSLKYLSVKIGILEKLGDCHLALKFYRQYSIMLERYQNKLLSEDLLFAEKKHQLEIDKLMQIQSRNKIILIIIYGALILLLTTGILFFRNRWLRSKRIIAEKENENLRLEQENLLSEKIKAELERDKKILETENLEKENIRLEAVRKQRELEAVNLKYEIEQLERERNDLRDILREQSELAKPLQDVIKLRLEMLNSLLAKEISHNESYAKPYNTWIESIRNEKAEFMNSTRLAFSVSHPLFMEYLEEHLLTVDEINYLCLYAIGLRGKEVGEYIQLKRHYNISSGIRRKLGIDEHETNIGLFIRRMMKNLDS